MLCIFIAKQISKFHREICKLVGRGVTSPSAHATDRHSSSCSKTLGTFANKYLYVWSNARSRVSLYPISSDKNSKELVGF